MKTKSPRVSLPLRPSHSRKLERKVAHLEADVARLKVRQKLTRVKRQNRSLRNKVVSLFMETAMGALEE